MCYVKRKDTLHFFCPLPNPSNEQAYNCTMGMCKKRTAGDPHHLRRLWLLLGWLVCFLPPLIESVSASVSPNFRELYFSVEPSDVIAVRDRPAIFNCVAGGDSSLQIQWKRDELYLHLEGDVRRSILPNGSLYFSNILPTSRSERPDEGLYQCVATSGQGDIIVSRSAKLQIASLPRFDEQPRDITLFPGQTARFACGIQGIPPATINWLKDEMLLQFDPTRMIMLLSGSLEIDHVQVGDQGSYRCNASILDRHRVSQSGMLTLNLDSALGNKISAPHFVATPQDVLVEEGSVVTLDCAANGIPRPRITWLKDGVTIDLSDLDGRFFMVGTGNLQIQGVLETDQGNYMCRAENHEDSVDAGANIDVQVPPRFVKRPVSRYAFEKEDVELECEIYGRPEPTVQWLKNGELLVESDYFQLVNGYNLKILGLVSSDTSIYQCVGSNSAGNIQASAQLIILKSDSFNPTTVTSSAHFDTSVTVDEGSPSQDTPSAPQDLRVAVASTRFVTLTWQAPSRPAGDILAYSVYYRRTDSTREQVVNTTRFRLEEVSIRGLRSATTYFFRVVAYNKNGPGETSEEVEVVTLTEADVPNAPENVRVVAISPTKILVEWDPPNQYSGPIAHYKLYYMEVGTSEEHEVETVNSPHTLWGLNKFTEYSIWVAAVNQNGPGLSAEEIPVRTLSDLPSETPQNVTLEAASSTSIIVRWESPPKESANGVITGYKIRYKQKGSRRGDTVTTDGNRRLYALINLERGAEYSVRMAALNVNGTGPYTEWMTAETYQNDLDESRVPDRPHSLKVRPSSNSIIVTWTPPHSQSIMIRGYTIGWGIGVPDVYTKVLDGKQRHYQIDNLQPSSEYVISLRAYNQMGDGQPIYETVKTRIITTPEPLSPMIPPVGLRAIVLSPSSAVLYWTDSTLLKNQMLHNDRYYIVRFTTYFSTNPRYKYANATDLNLMIDDLKPNTQYEFSVKVVKGRRESTWSLSVFNTTHEAAPTTPPRDLTVVSMESNPAAIILNWQPPKQPNGQITGYMVFYTTDNTQKERDWVVEGVVGDKMTTVIRGLTPNTTYYFKIQARNNKGYGPLSQIVVFRTGASSLGVDSSLDDLAYYSWDGRGGPNSTLHIIIACVAGITVIFIIGITVIICRRRRNYNSERKKKGYLGKVAGKGKSDIKPPDLWIHHDRMELKDVDKSRSVETTMTVTPIPRNSQDLDADEKIHRDSLEKRAPTYIAIATATPIPNGSLSQHGDTRDLQSASRPIYPRTQYNIPRAHVTIDTGPGGSNGNSPDLPSPGTYNQQAPVPYDQVAGHPGVHAVALGSTAVGTGQLSSYSAGPGSNNSDPNSGTLGKRPAGHPLKSFSVPAPPPQSAPTTPQPKHIVRPQQSASPYKKPSISTVSSTSPPTNPAAKSHSSQMPLITPRTHPDSFKQMGRDDKLAPSYSSEELTAEMANLEGLMKDLNAITASEFEC